MDFWKELGDVCLMIAENRRQVRWLAALSDRYTHHHPRLAVYAAIDAARNYGK